MMKKLATAVALSALVLSGCGFRDSRVNPFNWFGRSQEVQVAQPKEVNPLIPTRAGGLFRGGRARREAALNATTPIGTISDLAVERVSGGAVIRATGFDARQGTYRARLVPNLKDEIPEDGVLIYRFERLRPDYATQAGTQASREVTVARRISDQQLRGVREIRVVAANNALYVRR
jgi:hypothetical protein